MERLSADYAKKEHPNQCMSRNWLFTLKTIFSLQGDQLDLKVGHKSTDFMDIHCQDKLDFAVYPAPQVSNLSNVSL